MLASTVVTAQPAKTGGARAPLLMQGKSTIYERVLTRPGASLAATPGEAGKGSIAAFTRYYVYGRKTVANSEWLEVGADSGGGVKGWLKSDQTVPWRQQLALAFTPPGNRPPLLFFKDRASLETIVGGKDAGKAAAPIRQALTKTGKEPRILSVEPETSVDINKNFYLLPILQAEEIYSGAGPTVRLLEVASVTDDPKDTKPKPGTPQASMKNFNAAVVFVIDSTISMGPYIERTRYAVQRIYDKVEASKLADQVKFGLVAFRASPKSKPGLEYASKEFVDPSEVKSGREFLNLVRDLKPATVSTPRFDEDAFAGVMTALRDIDWADYGARYLILITDAGALSAKDALSSTGLDAREVRMEAKHRGVAIYTLHLKTAEGVKNHASAQAQYEELSSHELVKTPLYFAVESGSVEQFGKIVDALGDTITEQVAAAYRGESVAGSARTADPKFGEPKAGAKDDPVARAKRDAAQLGYAMKLAYLGREQGVEAPSVFQAWIADRDLADPTLPTTEVRVLLTKNELSNLQLAVKDISEAALKGVTSPDSFFEQLSVAAARTSRDPSAGKPKKGAKIADLGLLGEYMDGLPYRSDILNLDQDAWRAMSAGDQESLIRSMNKKLRLYQLYNADNDRWVRLAEGGDPKDDVYPVPLEAMP
ncbi:MAG: vWA domain-containing protein [Panacagrimonas sp.]